MTNNEVSPFETSAPMFAPGEERRTPAPAWAQQGEQMRDWFALFQESWTAAQVLAQTDFVPRDWKEKPHSVAAAMMRGFEMGMTPIDALANMYVVHGRIGFSAELMRRRIIEAGHEYRIVESTDTRCKISARRKGTTEWQDFVFTAEQAKRAKIDIQAYPADKLLARASSRMCRHGFPEVLNGAMIVDALDDFDETPVEAAPAPAAIDQPRTAKRRTAPKKSTAKAPSRATTEAEETTPAGPPPLPGEDDDILGPAAAEPTEPEPQPEPEPEPSESRTKPDNAQAADESGEPLCTQPQQKKLAILLDQERVGDRQAKLDYLESQFSRKFSSSKDLTKREASELIDFLERAQAEDVEKGRA